MIVMDLLTQLQDAQIVRHADDLSTGAGEPVNSSRTRLRRTRHTRCY
jgi:hypothetical protein